MYSAESMHRVARIRTRVLKAGSVGSCFEERQQRRKRDQYAKGKMKEEWIEVRLTTQLSSEVARAAELDASRCIPRRLKRRSSRFSKLVLGGSLEGKKKRGQY